MANFSDEILSSHSGIPTEHGWHKVEETKWDDNDDDVLLYDVLSVMKFTRTKAVSMQIMIVGKRSLDGKSC